MSDSIGMDFPGNSRKLRPVKVVEPKKRVVEKVVSGEIIQRKKPLGRKIVESFAGDDVQSVGSYVLFDVLIPAAKSTITDMVSQAIERFFYGDSHRRTSSGSSTNFTNYRNMHNSSTSSQFSSGKRELSKRSKATHDFNEIVIASRGEAEEVIDMLRELIDQFGQATVADLYDLAGITSDFPDNKWGWTDLRGASVRLVREGYLLELPRTSPID